MIADTATLLGTLRTESAAYAEAEGAGSPGRTDYRPQGTPLLNDGKHHYWMIPGEDYEIRRDGDGWRVTCRTWPANGHVYRLATTAWHLADSLIIDTGRFISAYRLGPDRAYVLHAIGHTWELHELG